MKALATIRSDVVGSLLRLEEFRFLRQAAGRPGKLALIGPDRISQRIDQAAKYAPSEQPAISPQCGFSSDVVGNLISEEDQKRKLERVVETARQVWG